MVTTETREEAWPELAEQSTVHPSLAPTLLQGPAPHNPHSLPPTELQPCGPLHVQTATSAMHNAD